jgi:hypothetical protein
MKTTIKILSFFFILFSLLFIACSGPADDETGAFSVTIGGSGVSRTILPWGTSTVQIEDLDHTITLSGPGATQSKTIPAGPVGGTENFQVVPGNWTISVEGRYGGALVSFGSDTKNIAAGPNGTVSITMHEPSTPIAAHYTFGNTSQTAGSTITAVTITPNGTGCPTAASNIQYQDSGWSATVPQTAGTYSVRFDVAEGGGWYAASGLSAGNLVVAAPHTHTYSSWVVTNDSTYPATSTGTCTTCGATSTRATEIGDTGPGGGKIIFVYPTVTGFAVEGHTGGPGAFTGYTAHYLEAAPTNMGTLMWSPTGYLITGLSNGASDYTDSGLGRGKKNTALILDYYTSNPSTNPANLQTDAPAAYECANYSTPTAPAGEWYLPNDEELNQLMFQKSIFGITTGTYWTSSQRNNSNAFYFDFGAGSGSNMQKSGTHLVHAIRAC